MGKQRDSAAAFTLTPYEANILQLKRQGLKYREIIVALGGGMTLRGLARTLTVIVDKERLMNIIQAERRIYGTSSLSRARGETRMEGTK